MGDIYEELQEAISRGDIEEVAYLLQEIEQFKTYNKLYVFQPYPYQKRFMKAGSKYKQRLMRSGNQTGKSYGASFEFAMHLTGQYQSYYEGERITDSGHLYWCIGIDLDSTARVMQRALFGTADVRIIDEVGTGSIPLDCIDMNSMTKDGGRIASCRIKHADGGWNTLQFFGAAQGQERLMGAKVKGVWIDEEPKHNSMAIYSQCLTRTTTTNGFIMMTSTPEQGYTDLQRMFAEDKTGQLYVDSASWDECPHIKPEDIARLLAGVPEHEHDMRRKGMPVLGSGAIFPFSDASITCEDILPQAHWPIIAGLDFSSVNDASVVAYATFDPETETYYLYKAHYITDNTQKNPEYMAQLITNGEYPLIPAVSPHDGGVNSVSPEAKAKVMKRMGVNVLSRCFYNPPNIGLGIGLSRNTTSSIAREPGLTEMRRLMTTGKLKICKSVIPFFEEKAQLFYAPASGGGVKTVGRDDLVDASRYAIISLVANRGVPAGQCNCSPEDFNNGFTNSDDNHVVWEIN